MGGAWPLRNQVRIISRTEDWLRYDVPDRWIRRDLRGIYKGQKQIWFLLEFLGKNKDINLKATNHPEFEAWKWNDYWVPLSQVIDFKRGVYKEALKELAPALFTDKKHLVPPAGWEKAEGPGHFRLYK